jgi:hypothetical protein
MIVVPLKRFLYFRHSKSCINVYCVCICIPINIYKTPIHLNKSESLSKGIFIMRNMKHKVCKFTDSLIFNYKINGVHIILISELSVYPVVHQCDKFDSRSS